MESINDVVREMRAYAEKSEIDGGPIDVWDWLTEFADRIEAAYRRDMNTVADEVARLKKQVSELCHFGVCRSEKCSCCENATNEIKE